MLSVPASRCCSPVGQVDWAVTHVMDRPRTPIPGALLNCMYADAVLTSVPGSIAAHATNSCRSVLTRLLLLPSSAPLTPSADRRSSGLPAPSHISLLPVSLARCPLQESTTYETSLASCAGS